jgi:hypothetical protein
MTDETANEFMMIGLHKLAADRDDGLVPELMAICSERRRMAMQASNVVAFPDELASPASAHPLGNDNVIAFTPYLAQKARRR